MADKAQVNVNSACAASPSSTSIRPYNEAGRLELPCYADQWAERPNFERQNTTTPETVRGPLLHPGRAATTELRHFATSRESAGSMRPAWRPPPGNRLSSGEGTNLAR